MFLLEPDEQIRYCHGYLTPVSAFREQIRTVDELLLWMRHKRNRKYRCVRRPSFLLGGGFCTVHLLAHHRTHAKTVATRPLCCPQTIHDAEDGEAESRSGRFRPWNGRTTRSVPCRFVTENSNSAARTQVGAPLGGRNLSASPIHTHGCSGSFYYHSPCSRSGSGRPLDLRRQHSLHGNCSGAEVP